MGSMYVTVNSQCEIREVWPNSEQKTYIDTETDLRSE